MQLEVKTGTGSEYVISLDEDTNDISLHEYDLIRISASVEQVTDEIFINLDGLSLEPYHDNQKQRVYFVDNAAEAERTNGFFRGFLNEYSKNQIVIHNGEDEVRYDIEIKSSKIDSPKLDDWLSSIFEVFPVLRLDNLEDARSRTVSINSMNGFISLNQFIRELTTVLDRVMISIEREGYLQSTYRSDSSRDIRHQQSNLMQDWLGPKTKWRKTKLNESNLRKIPLSGFQPINPPTLAAQKNNSHILNVNLANIIWISRNELHRLKAFVVGLNAASIEVRNAFTDNSKKQKYKNKILRDLQNCTERTNGILNRLKERGIAPRRGNFSHTISHKQIYTDYLDIENLLNIIRQPQVSGSILSGIPSVDYIFEYYCLATLIKVFVQNGYELVAVSDTSVVPSKITLYSHSEQKTYRIFYDQPLHKHNKRIEDFPLIEASAIQNSAPKRPDFVVERIENETSISAVLDAKYRSYKDCRKKNFGHKLNSDNLTAKYSNNIFHANEYGFSPVVIGAMCLADSDAQLEILHDKNSSISIPFIKPMIWGLSDKYDEDIADLFYQLIEQSFDSVASIVFK